MSQILVINPNSNESVTEGLRKSLQKFNSSADIECRTLEDGPFGIETDEDIVNVIPLVVQRISESPEFDAYVIACYSDPGLAECNELFSKPVFGMQRSAIEKAISTGEKFGVLALSEQSIKRHMAYMRGLGLDEQLAGELPLDISVDEAANDTGSFEKIVSQGRRLIDELGADVLILGCAGMASHREPSEKVLQVPVIEPAQAAVSIAIEAV
ncbi:MAG: aspartate/glutamate racemase family protein [Candidatus Marinimicrobia bacterium]|jgi:Asp/Glu/hydantoin racemase|nr:aspartate/glutamate racemase family protein [Candidatus Neomarinimicrobiota bacterium]MDP7060341.1 aspartate/glutamate racemase family protein [Candidatus Neomarinimicrobiota bacterium]|tara:strand:- start:121 stop:756 length:636 start_codon:yes stop_codon:yes gene_type:complete